MSVGLLDDADDDAYDPRVDGAMAPPKKHAGLAAFVGGVSNFSVQFNFQCLSAAVAIMTAAGGVPIPKDNKDHLVPDYAEPVRIAGPAHRPTWPPERRVSHRATPSVEAASAAASRL